MKGLSHCDFCDEFSGGAQNPYAARYGTPPQSRIVFGTRNFVVMPTLGQVVEGYLLLVPVEHFTTLADLPQELALELEGLTDPVRATLSELYGPCVFFEHGARSENSGGCGVYHAHLHAVPLKERREPLSILKQRFAYRKLGGIRDIATEANGTDSYLYYEDLRSNRYIFDVGYLPSQYMRRLLAEVIGKGEWDWRKCGREEALLSTIARLSQAFRPEPSNPADPDAASAVAGQPL